jgi:uncharacterized protein YjiS (DUF1127 family)
MKDYALNRAIFLEQANKPGFLRRMIRNWSARRDIAKLTALDDRLLRDIGVTREDIEWARGLPLAMSAAATAQAADQCGPHEKIIEVLAGRFQENRQALGLAGQSTVVELFVSNEGTWTLTTTTAAGLTCVVASGEAWQTMPKQVAGLDS